jgi:hypothetical protein
MGVSKTLTEPLKTHISQQLDTVLDLPNNTRLLKLEHCDGLCSVQATHINEQLQLSQVEGIQGFLGPKDNRQYIRKNAKMSTPVVRESNLGDTAIKGCLATLKP